MPPLLCKFLLCPLFFLLFFVCCKESFVSSFFSHFVSNHEIEKNGVRLRVQPPQNPNIISPSFFYPQASLQWTASYANGSFFRDEEAILIFESKASLQKLKKYYIKNIRKKKWQIIQYYEKKDAVLLTTESPMHRLITVVLREGKVRKIKLYIRPVPL